MGTGNGPPMPNPYASSQPPAGNGTYGGGGPPPGFEGMASPYYQGGTTTTGGGKQEASRKTFNFTAGLRVAAILLSLLSLCLVASANRSLSTVTTDGESTFVETFDRKAMRVRSSRFLVAMAAIVIFYEVVQIVLSCLDRTRAITFMSNYAGLLATFLVDQVLAYLVFAAAATIADLTAAGRYGDGTSESSCSGWGSWCSQLEAGVAMAYFAFGALSGLAIITGARFNNFS